VEGSGSLPETVRGMDAAPGAPMEGFTAFSGRDPEPSTPRDAISRDSE